MMSSSSSSSSSKCAPNIVFTLVATSSLIFSTSIIMTPNSNTSMPLPDLLKQMDEISAGAERPVEDTGETVQDIIAEQVDMSLEDDNKKIAQNLLIQAVMLEEEAEKKRAEAVKYDPTLAEKAEKPAKRGRGRPSGTTAKAMKARAEAAAPAE